MGFGVGDKVVCSECGMELEVTKGCSCQDCQCSFVCCGKPMEVKGKEGGCGCCCS